MKTKILKIQMHNLKEIRKDFAAFEKSLEKRLIDIDFNKLKDLDIRETLSIAPLMLMMLFIGIYPSYIESFVIQEAGFISETIALFKDVK